MSRAVSVVLALTLLSACGSEGTGSGEATGAPPAPAPAADAGTSPPATTPDPPATTCATEAAKEVVPTDEVVITESGAVRGVGQGESIAFLGIPYAAAPIATLRWKPPTKPACWKGIRDAKAFGHACPQNLTGIVAGAEDCLNVNVWKPRAAKGSSLPVLVWIHGGAFITGASDSFAPGIRPGVYDGQKLAEERNAVVVSLNYRLGALGFLATPALAAEDPHGSTGNYGFLDQIAALQWVQANVAQFGGDPSKVMVFGESAGAFSVCALVASPLTKGLFSSALMQSGACEAPTLAAREARHAKRITDLGCGDVPACLRQLPLEKLVPSPTSVDTAYDYLLAEDDGTNREVMEYGATIDGWFLPAEPIAQLEKGAHQRVPMIIGSNADEMAFFLKQGSLPTCFNYDALVATRFGDRATKVLQKYPCLGSLTPTEAAIELYTDMVFTCPSRRAARAAAKWSPGSVYRYLFTKGMIFSAQWLDRAFHTAEIPYVFGTFSTSWTSVPTSVDLDLSAKMMGYWTQLAQTGNPNGSGLPAWAPYEIARDNAATLDASIGVKEPIRAERCDLWDSFRQ